MNILKESNRLKLEKENIEYKIIKLQAICPHDAIEGEYGGSTGNYDPSSDCYYITARCLVCDKRLFAEEGSDLYKFLANTGMIDNKYDSTSKKMKIKLRRIESLGKYEYGVFNKGCV